MTVQALAAAGYRGVAAGIALVASVGALALGGVASASEARHDPGEAAGEAGDRLGRLINERIRADGPFFTAPERAVIERECGYPAGSYDGFDANMTDGTFICSNGRRVDSPEMRAVMEAAGPRIGARVSGVMESAEVRAAISEIARTAQAEAMRGVDQARIAAEVAARVEVDVDRAMAEAERAIEEARRESRRAARK